MSRLDEIAKAAANAIMPEQAAEDLYWKLHSLSKSLESNGIIDERRDRAAYGAILEAMALVAKFRPASQ